jgi:hypothetical protein
LQPIKIANSIFFGAVLLLGTAGREAAGGEFSRNAKLLIFLSAGTSLSFSSAQNAKNR